MDRKEMVRKYKEAPRPRGVYRVQHKPTGRTLFGSSPDAPAMLNRVRAELRMKTHRNRALQMDWDLDGPDAFLFEVVDLLPATEVAEGDPGEELALFEEMWRERLKLQDDNEY